MVSVVEIKSMNRGHSFGILQLRNWWRLCVCRLKLPYMTSNLMDSALNFLYSTRIPEDPSDIPRRSLQLLSNYLLKFVDIVITKKLNLGWRLYCFKTKNLRQGPCYFKSFVSFRVHTVFLRF